MRYPFPLGGEFQKGKVLDNVILVLLYSTPMLLEHGILYWDSGGCRIHF